MAEFLREMATVVEAGTTEAGSTHATWKLYGGGLPDSTHVADRAVGLIQTAGVGDVGSATTDRADVERPGLQVLVRGLPRNQYSSAYEEASGVARAVKNALHGFTGPSSSGGTHYIGIWSQGSAGWIGDDQSGRPMFSANFRVERSKS